MKKNKYIIHLLVGLFCLNSFSCADYVEDINVDPNNATNAPIDNLIIAAQVSLAGVFEGEDARLAAMWAQQFTGSDRQYVTLNQYVATSETFSWFQAYVGVINSCNIAIEKLEEEPIVNKKNVGMLKVMKAMIFGHLTSLYGDVPFSEANQAPAIKTPKFDDQSAVYAGLQTLLTEAITDLGGSGNISSDVLGGSSATTWIAAANTLKARYYLHVGDYTNAITSAGTGLAPGVDLSMAHGNVLSGSMNLWYDFHEVNRSGYLTAEDALLPRMLDFSQPEYRGDAKTDESERFAFLYTGTAGTYDLNVADGMFAMDASFPVLTGIENQLILAESQLRKSSPDKAAALAALNDVRATLQAQFSGGTYDAYVDADFATNADLLDEIIEEKYVSLVGQIEVFNDLRRTNNAIGLTPVTGSALPERYIVPTDEINANPNVPSPLPDLFDPTDVNK